MIKKTLKNQVFGRLTVIDFHEMDKSGKNSMWLCICECGNQVIVSRSNLSSGCSKSCGCLKSPPILTKIFKKIQINENGCWEWTDTKTPQGYGRLRYKGKQQPSHRVVYMELVGEIPESLFVCHHCDNRICCNPNHLFLGTQKDNLDDASRKGRLHRPKGENHPHHKLTEKIVLDMRARYSDLCNISNVSKEFGVPYAQTCKILRKDSWKHI